MGSILHTDSDLESILSDGRVPPYCLFTNGPPAIEQTDAGNFGAEYSVTDIVGRRKFSELFGVDG